jgi:hypothetical protein
MGADTFLGIGRREAFTGLIGAGFGSGTGGGGISSLLSMIICWLCSGVDSYPRYIACPCALWSVLCMVSKQISQVVECGMQGVARAGVSSMDNLEAATFI